MKNNKLQEAKHHIAKLISEQETSEETKTMGDLANKFLDISKRLRANEYKGLQPSEINVIDDLMNVLLQGSMEGNFTTILNRIQDLLSKNIKGTSTLPGAEPIEPELDIEDETI
jgi:hypothetical protein